MKNLVRFLTMRTVFLPLTLTTLAASAQDLFKRNSVYVEAAGNGVHGSVNYERQLFSKPGLGVRVGLGGYFQEKPQLTIPVGLSYLIKLRNDRSFLDTGLGATWTDREAFSLLKSNPGHTKHIYLIPSIGYRRQTGKGLLWRVSFTPAITNIGPFPWGGLSVGKVF